ncbi:hypothetical protein CKAN_00138300 [Cinnamomum micranthum f. kanehirae]|uniref:Uncharacterized protein n=1 Tax=Cinnamomum micranthum f. kanehirae TaxID=337451 RepID=A0A3S3N5H7_9MAGN|nr:hypothetical protein CKAN_00138300 [Cinnamomum micranthum f. kanehirae]
MACSRSELMKPKSCKEKTTLTKPRYIYLGLFHIKSEATQYRAQAILGPWDHVGSSDVCVPVGSCDICDHSFRLWDHGKSHLAQDLTQVVMVYSALFF